MSQSINKITFLFIFLGIVFVLPSCQSSRFAYMQETRFQEIEGFVYSTQDNTYRLRSGDKVSINIFSPNKEVSNYLQEFNKSVSTLESVGYKIDDNGNIYIPIIGFVFAKGLSLKEFETSVAEKLAKVVEDAYITVDLSEFKILILGEINAQGEITIKKNTANILEVITLAGGVTDYGNRANVLVLRQEDEGYKTFHIDLTSREIISSPDFHLFPNDIIYVEPLKSKSLRIQVTDYTFFITTFTSLLSTIMLIITLTKF